MEISYAPRKIFYVSVLIMTVFFLVSASVTSVNTTIFTDGEDAILFCNVSGFPPPVVSWFNDKNENVNNGSMWKLLSINRSYNGTYQCIASNACRMDSKTFDIIVQCKSVGKPDFRLQPIYWLSFSDVTYLYIFRLGLKLKL